MSKYQNTYEDSYDYTPDCSTCYYYPLNFDDEPCSMCYPGNCFYTNTIPNAKNIEKGENDAEEPNS